MSEEAEIAGRSLMEKAQVARDEGLAVSVYVHGKKEPIPVKAIQVDSSTARIETPGTAVYYVALGSVIAIGTAPLV
jgi:hypothetical protein